MPTDPHFPDSFGVDGSADITLYSYEFSPFAAKVRCFLGYKNLQYATHYVHPLKAKIEIPLGHQIPVIEIDGELHADSTPLGILLDEKFPHRPIFSSLSVQQRAGVLEVDSWVSAELVRAESTKR